MASVTGKTSNGYTYEADYEPAGAGWVNWTATFRRDGDFAGMRHGRLRGLGELPPASVDVAVKGDIETIWTEAT